MKSSIKSISLLTFCLLAFCLSVDGAALQPNPTSIPMYVNLSVASGQLTIDSPEWHVDVYGFDSGNSFELPLTGAQLKWVSYLVFSTPPGRTQHPIFNSRSFGFPSANYGFYSSVVLELWSYTPDKNAYRYVAGAQATIGALMQHPNTFNWTLVDPSGKSPGFLTLNWV